MYSNSLQSKNSESKNFIKLIIRQIRILERDYRDYKIDIETESGAIYALVELLKTYTNRKELYLSNHDDNFTDILVIKNNCKQVIYNRKRNLLLLKVKSYAYLNRHVDHCKKEDICFDKSNREEFPDSKFMWNECNCGCDKCKDLFYIQNLNHYIWEMNDYRYWDNEPKVERP